jgi:hypothetical protein
VDALKDIGCEVGWLLWGIVPRGVGHGQLHVEQHAPHRTAQATFEAVIHRSEVYRPLGQVQVVRDPESLRVDRLLEGLPLVALKQSPLTCIEFPLD